MEDNPAPSSRSRRKRADDTHGRSISGESANNHQSESERTICVGLRCKYVDNAAKTCPTYCLEKFDFCMGAFRAKNCLLQEKGTMEEGTGNWKRLGDDEWQCINCYNKKKGITQARHPPLFNQSPGSDGLSAVLSTSEATARVIYLYAEAEDDESFLALSEAIGDDSSSCQDQTSAAGAD